MGDILFEREGHLARIILNRPAQANVFTEELIQGWIRALEEVRDNDEIYAVLLSGNGKHFCAGGDVRTMAAGKGFFQSDEDLSSTALKRKESLWKKIQRVPLLLEEIDKPVVAKLQGAAMGAGLDMALMCDVRIAASDARLGESYFNVGIVPGDGGAYFLPPLVRTDRALDLFWTRKTVSGTDAEQMGLVTYAVPPEELDAFTDAYMKNLLEMPQAVARFTKRAVRESKNMSLRASLDMISSAMGIVTELDDYKERTVKIAERIHAVRQTDR